MLFRTVNRLRAYLLCFVFISTADCLRAHLLCCVIFSTADRLRLHLLCCVLLNTVDCLRAQLLRKTFDLPSLFTYLWTDTWSFVFLYSSVQLLWLAIRISTPAFITINGCLPGSLCVPCYYLVCCFCIYTTCTFCAIIPLGLLLVQVYMFQHIYACARFNLSLADNFFVFDQVFSDYSLLFIVSWWNWLIHFCFVT